MKFLCLALVMLISGNIIFTDDAAAQSRKKAKEIEFTYEGSPNDELFRSLFTALHVFQIMDQAPEGATCEYIVVAEPLAKKFRKKNELPEDLELLTSVCHFEDHDFCEESWYSGKTKCYERGSVMLDVFKLSKNGNSVEAKTLYAFTDPDESGNGGIANIFKFSYYGTKTKKGWVFDRKAYKGMYDL